MANPQRQVDALQRQKQALELRCAGRSYRDIAEALGYRGPSGAHSAVMSALKRTLQEPADELRKLEVARLDRMLWALWKQVIKGDGGAIDRVLRIMERRAKLLGIDAPTRTQVTGEDGGAVHLVVNWDNVTDADANE